MKTNMRLIVALFITVLLILLVPGVKAATPNEEIYNYFKSESYVIGGTTYTVSTEQLTVLERFLNEVTLTSDQVTLVKANAEKVVNILKAQKTVDVNKLSSSARSQIENIANETAKAVGITEAKYSSSANAVLITYNNRTDSVPLSLTIVQTGHTYVPYIIASAVAIIAVATIALRKRVK